MKEQSTANGIDTIQLLTRAELSDRLKLSKRTISRMLSAGELPSVRIGRLVRFRESDIAQLIERLIDQNGYALYNGPTAQKKDLKTSRKQ